MRGQASKLNSLGLTPRSTARNAASGPENRLTWDRRSYYHRWEGLGSRPKVRCASLTSLTGGGLGHQLGSRLVVTNPDAMSGSIWPSTLDYRPYRKFARMASKAPFICCAVANRSARHEAQALIRKSASASLRSGRFDLGSITCSPTIGFDPGYGCWPLHTSS